VRRALGGSSVFGSDIVPLKLVRNSNDGSLSQLRASYRRVARRMLAAARSALDLVLHPPVDCSLFSIQQPRIWNWSKLTSRALG
jgi:hypothetical protein